MCYLPVAYSRRHEVQFDCAIYKTRWPDREVPCLMVTSAPLPAGPRGIDDDELERRFRMTRRSVYNEYFDPEDGDWAWVEQNIGEYSG